MKADLARTKASVNVEEDLGLRYVLERSALHSSTRILPRVLLQVSDFRRSQNWEREVAAEYMAGTLADFPVYHNRALTKVPSRAESFYSTADRISRHQDILHHARSCNRIPLLAQDYFP